jgi:hypothetical protein
MRKPNSFSVTRIRCSCGTLKRGAQDPNLPIRFDPELNEYSFEHLLPRNRRVSMIIYHCPMCGGVASESKRSKLFAAVSKREALRLKAITDGLESVRDIENTLGIADEVRTYRPLSGFVETRPQSRTRETRTVRILIFARLSDTANVEFKAYSNGEVERIIAPKSLIGSARAARKRTQGRDRRAPRR